MQNSNYDIDFPSTNSPLENETIFSSTYNKPISNSHVSSLEYQRKTSENSSTNASKTNQTLKFDTSQIKFFVDKTKNLNAGMNKSKGNKESFKSSKVSVKSELEKITEKISEKLSEKYSSSKSSYSKPHSQDSKEESKILDQSNLKENDFSKKKTSINPLENLDLVYLYFLLFHF